MKLDKNSNTYIIIYIVILVVIVGAALAFTSMSLRPLQQANADADKMRQILASVHISSPKDEIIPTYEKVIIDQFVVDSDGNRVDGEVAFSVNVANEVKKPSDERLLPVYEAKMADGSIKYVLPAYGAGLWGPIWGYVSVDSDGTTVYGAYFSHQGETPGLGAEIEKPAFSDQFDGKKLFKNGVFFPIEVIKRGFKPEGDADFVDGISGGTITSKGVGSMLDNCLKPYENFLNSLNR